MESPYKQQIQNQIQHIGQQGNLHGEIAVLLCPENGRTVVVQSNERIGQGRYHKILPCIGHDIRFHISENQFQERLVEEKADTSDNYG